MPDFHTVVEIKSIDFDHVEFTRLGWLKPFQTGFCESYYFQLANKFVLVKIPNMMSLSGVLYFKVHTCEHIVLEARLIFILDESYWFYP